eukprot:s603_g11.t1
MPVGTAGNQPRVPDPSGHCRTSTASSRCQWALPDLNRELQMPAGRFAVLVDSMALGISCTGLVVNKGDGQWNKMNLRPQTMFTFA